MLVPENHTCYDNIFRLRKRIEKKRNLYLKVRDFGHGQGHGKLVGFGTNIVL